MSLDENKAGAAAVDPSDFNTVVDAVVVLQAGGGGGGSLTVTDGSTTVADVTTASFVGSAVVGDNGGGNAEIAVRPTLTQVLDEDNDGGGNGMSNVGGIDTGGGNVGTSGGTLDSGGGDLDLGAGTVLADLTMGAGKNVVLNGGNIDLQGGALAIGSIETYDSGAADSARIAAIEAILTNLGLADDTA